MDVMFNKIIPMSDLKKLSMLDIRLYVPKDRINLKHDIVKRDSKYYYLKDANSFEILNELIGSCLAHKIDLDTVDYEIVKEDARTYKVMSEVFYDKLYNYQDAREKGPIFNENISKGLKGEKIASKYDNLIAGLLKLIALDLKMGQSDRNPKNIIIKESKIDRNDISLTETFDYGYSYADNPGTNRMYYENPYVSIRKNMDSVYEFASMNSGIVDAIKTLKNINIIDILSEITDTYDIELSDNVKKYYMGKDLTNNELFRRI